MWHVTCDMWHMEGGDFQVSSSYGLGVKVFHRYLKKEHLPIEKISDKGVASHRSYKKARVVGHAF